MKNEEEEGKNETAAQFTLDGRPLTNKVMAHLQCKHNALDSVTGERKITLYGELQGKAQISSFNINLNGVSEDQYRDLLESLGIPELTSDTPLSLAIFRPEGTLLDDWKDEQEEEE